MDREHMRAGLRLQDVARWNMVRTIRPQSVMEHSAAVAFIAARLATKMGLDPKEAMYWGMMHDIDEATTGDIPSHVKRAVKRAGVDMNEMTNFIAVPPAYRDIIKIADKMEGCVFLREYRHGSHAQWVLCDIDKNFDEAVSRMSEDWQRAVHSVWAEVTQDIKPDFDFAVSEHPRLAVAK